MNSSPPVAGRKEDVLDAVQGHLLRLAPLLQRDAIEQRAGWRAGSPLVERVVALRVAIYENHVGMVGVDPIHKASPDVLS